MTAQQQKFINAYFLNNCNATEAAQAAGYKSPAQRGCEIKKLPEVAAEIERRLAESAMSANEVLARLTEHARADMADLLNFGDEVEMTPEQIADRAAAEQLIAAYPKNKQDAVRAQMGLKKADPYLDLRMARRTGKSRLIKSLDPTEFGVKITLHDAQAALVQLGRFHKLFTDKVEHDFSALSDDELDRRIKAAEAREAEATGTE